MKKFIVTILAVFYFGASSGAAVHIHYCMGQLIDWSISKSGTGSCTNCGMEKDNSKDCCKDKQHQLTLKDSPKASKVVYHFNTIGAEIPLTSYKEFEKLNFKSLDENKAVINSPPRTQAVSAFIRNCTFRI